MAAKTFRSLTQLAAVGNIECRCRVCPHKSILPGPALAHYFSIRCWPCDLEVAGFRLRCTRCRYTNPSLRATCESANGPWRPPVTEEGWKNLMRRLRD